MEKLIIIKQENGGLYLFNVPLNNNVFAGEGVILDTRRGERFGVAVCDAFLVDDDTAAEIMETFGTNAKGMRAVKGLLSRVYFREKYEEPTAEIIEIDADDVVTCSEEKPGHGYGDQNHTHRHWKEGDGDDNN